VESKALVSIKPFLNRDRWPRAKKKEKENQEHKDNWTMIKSVPTTIQYLYKNGLYQSPTPNNGFKVRL
jgi:hypothetical protein